MRRSMIAGNWKMHGSTRQVAQLLNEIKSLATGVSDTELVVFPPYVYLSQVQQELADSDISWGAQNLSEYTSGAYTGEIAASMLSDFGCRYVLIGHSERRHIFKESNDTIAQKFVTTLQGNLLPILCVGETLAERESGKTLDVIHEQLAVVFALFDNQPAFTQAVIAYEPVWAIGTGRNATPEQAQEVHAQIRQQLNAVNTNCTKMRILYGGSVKPDNASSLLAMPDIDGALVGGASLDANKFIEIARQCNK